MTNLLKLWAKSSAREKIKTGNSLCAHSAAVAFQPMFAGKTVRDIEIILMSLEIEFYNEAKK